MAARRLIVIMIILLAISTVAALLVPSPGTQPGDEQTAQNATGPGGTTGSGGQAGQEGRSGQAEKAGGADRAADGGKGGEGDGSPSPAAGGSDVIHARISTRPGGRPDGKARSVRVSPGDRLVLSVSSRSGDDIEIPALGLFETAAPDAPAVFDMLVEREGTFPVRTVAGNRVAGRIVSGPARQ